MTLQDPHRFSCLGIITARGGSKGVKNKNVRSLGGLPTILYTINCGLNCDYIDELSVTTDSQEIRQLALDNGATAPFLRPPELASDLAKQEDAILHLMDWYESRGIVFDLICLLEPTCPLRQVTTLNKGFELLSTHPDCDAIFSICEAPISPIYCNEVGPDGMLTNFISDKYKFLNRQELPIFFKLCSLVTICRWNSFKKHRSFLLDTTLSMKVDSIEASDIDEPLDFFLVNHLMASNLTSKLQLDSFINGNQPFFADNS